MKLNLMWARPGVQRTDKSQNKMLKLEPEIILKKQIPWQKISLFRKNHLQKKNSNEFFIQSCTVSMSFTMENFSS